MKKFTLATVLAALPAAALAWPWSTDMMNQPSVKPQEPATGQNAPWPFPARSIPVQGVSYKTLNVTGRDQTREFKNPIPVSDESLKEGRTLFRIYCSACHGLTGQRETPVADKIGAISLADDYVQKDLSEGWIWGTITFGGAIMPAYGAPAGNPESNRGSNDLNEEERWHVVNYVKHGLLKEPAAQTVAAQ